MENRVNSEVWEIHPRERQREREYEGRDGVGGYKNAVVKRDRAKERQRHFVKLDVNKIQDIL